MKPTATTTLAALVAATLAIGAAAPVLAQVQAPNSGRTEMADRGHERGGRHEGRRAMQHRGDMGGGFLALVCSQNGSDRLEHMLLSIEQRTNPTSEQQGLYDAFKAAAVAAQADFSATCATARPADPDAAKGDLVDRLTAGHEVASARLAAMKTVLPSFEAFFDSLTDEQKQALEPRRDGKQHRGPGGNDHRNGPRHS